MPVQDALPCLFGFKLKADTANTDAYALTVPFTGKGYVVRRVTIYNSRNLVTGATASNASATFSVWGSAGGTGTPIVDDPVLYFRIGTASGVANSGFDVVVEISALP
mgnify:CR=1 FL=1